MNQNIQTNTKSTSAVRHLSSPTRICQINIEGVSRAKGEYLSKFLAENDIKFLLAQETHTESDEELITRCQISGYELIVAVHSRSHGIASYVKHGVNDVSIVETTAANNVYTSVIRTGNLHITNVYKSPQSNWTDSVMTTQSHPAIYAGDFNSHHSDWGYASNDTNGESVNSWASQNELHLVYDAKDRKSFHSKIHHTETNPDLCFVSTDEEGS